MMEGIFDFGMAGIRKGLRLTGLQENPTTTEQNKTRKPTKPSTKKLPKWQQIVPTSEDEITKPNENIWINPLLNSPNFEGEILLVIISLKKKAKHTQKISIFYKSTGKIPPISRE